MAEDSTGFVYVLSKESAPGYYKVGKTEKKPALRAAELDGTDSPTPSIVVYYVYCDDLSELEQAAHQVLQDKRVRTNREWFFCSQQEAMEAIRVAAQNRSITIFHEKQLVEPSAELAASVIDSNLIDDDDLSIEKIVDSIFRMVESTQEEIRMRAEQYKVRMLELRERRQEERMKGAIDTVSKSEEIAKWTFEEHKKRAESDLEQGLNCLFGEARELIGDVGVAKLQRLAEQAKRGEVFRKDVESQEGWAKNNARLDRLLKGIR